VNENLVDYNAAKGGIIAMTRDLAALLAPCGVQVNAISPGGFRHGTTDEFAAVYADRTPAGRMGNTGTDLQGAVIFLASQASDYVVGHNLVVDGGFTIWQ
jgi:NAD(P)-dependent dehydrogenase (short-subunit alcohol dehydrogenase family)